MKSSQQKGATILVVDDLPANLKMLTHLLTAHGYTVHPAVNGKSALRAVTKILPDLILLDIVMPVMSGYDVCRELKADAQTRHIPVIFISALYETFDKVKAFELGAVDYITKPFEIEEVLARVKTHLTVHRLQQQIQEQSQRFQALAEATFEGILIHTPEQILDVNHAFERIFGYQANDIIGSHDIFDFFAPEETDKLRLYQQIGVEESFRVNGLHKTGNVFPVEIQMRPIVYNGAPAYVAAIRDISKQQAIEQENVVLKSSIRDRYRLGEIIGKSQVMQDVYELVLSAAASDHHVVVSGESGTGKELVARTIHALSSRSERAFVPVNCGAVSESLFEREFFGHRKSAFTGADRDKPGFFDAAHRGTLFLDEVAELGLSMQVKLLRAIENGEYFPVGDNASQKADIRIIAATNRDLETQMREGLLREDFFYRIHVIEIKIPPLRERKEDIPLLLEAFLKLERPGGEPLRLPAKIEELIYRYDWPGNVRELQNRLKRYVSTKRFDLPANSLNGKRSRLPGEAESPSSANYSLHAAVEVLEKKMIAEALAFNHWQKGNTAAMLGIPRKTLQRKIEKYQLDILSHR